MQPFQEIFEPLFLTLESSRALEIVMERCWDKDPRVRPNIGEVVEDMSAIIKYFPPADADPLVIPEGDLSSRNSQV